MELFLLLFFVGIICAFVYVIKSSNEEPAPPTPPDPKPTPKPPEPVPVKKEEQKYVSIYEYTSLQSIKRCAHCDGENTYAAKVCQICGNDIDS